jgi:protein-S-isoprenylcysteine O-methyltransferase Ste14
VDEIISQLCRYCPKVVVIRGAPAKKKLAGCNKKMIRERERGVVDPNRKESERLLRPHQLVVVVVVLLVVVFLRCDEIVTLERLPTSLSLSRTCVWVASQMELSVLRVSWVKKKKKKKRNQVL